jgi:plasmid stabilization system protein ParE
VPALFQVEITPLAEADIAEIWDYIAADNPEAAPRFIEELERQLTNLEAFPERCPLIQENKRLGTNYRHLIYGNYRTIFRISGPVVYILRVIHGARLLESAW